MNYTPELTLEQKIELAQNPNTPQETLVKLATDNEDSIRWGVAENHNTPPEVLIKLASDKYSGLRWWVAQNPNTPPKTLKVLASDEDFDVRESAKKNLEKNHKTHNLKLTTNQYNALKALITASQDETLKGLMDS